jgi:hypothetical protein
METAAFQIQSPPALSISALQLYRWQRRTARRGPKLADMTSLPDPAILQHLGHSVTRSLTATVAAACEDCPDIEAPFLRRLHTSGLSACLAPTQNLKNLLRNGRRRQPIKKARRGAARLRKPI